MRASIAFMFSGQGSQYYCMGEELYQRNRTFRNCMDYCSALVEKPLGVNLVELLYQSRANRYEPFNRSIYTSPAIFMINYSVARALMAEGARPDLLLGYSMGEFVALAVSEALSVEDTLSFIVRTAHLIEEKTPEAGLLAILDGDELYRENPTRFQGLTIASRNFSRSFVVSGALEPLAELRRFLSAKEILTEVLPVRQAFHSPLIDGVEAEYKSLLEPLRVSTCRIPIWSSALLRPLNEEDVTAHYFWNVIRRPVDFQKSVEMLEARGSYLYVDAGPSGTLAMFVKYLLRPDSSSKALPILDRFGQNVQQLSRALHVINSRDHDA